MKILAAPASLKGVLAPGEAAALLAAGMRRVGGVEAVEAPVADGGEGTAEVVHSALAGAWLTAGVSAPLGRPGGARWLPPGDGTAARSTAGAGGGLGAACAAMGAGLVEGAELVLDVIGFDERARDASLVVTGEGTIDATTFEGKAPGAVLGRCRALGVRCELFGGIVRDGYDAHPLSGRR